MRIIIDTREQKTPRIIEQWKELHPIKAKAVEFEILTWGT
jgi:hypothetical protein